MAVLVSSPCAISLTDGLYVFPYLYLAVSHSINRYSTRYQLVPHCTVPRARATCTVRKTHGTYMSMILNDTESALYHLCTGADCCACMLHAYGSPLYLYEVQVQHNTSTIGRVVQYSRVRSI